MILIIKNMYFVVQIILYIRILQFTVGNTFQGAVNTGNETMDKFPSNKYYQISCF